MAFIRRYATPHQQWHETATRATSVAHTAKGPREMFTRLQRVYTRQQDTRSQKSPANNTDSCAQWSRAATTSKDAPVRTHTVGRRPRTPAPR